MHKTSILFLLFFLVASYGFSEDRQFWEYRIVKLNHRLTEKQLCSFGNWGWELCVYYEDNPVDPEKVKWNEDPRHTPYSCVLKTIYIYTFKRRAFGEG